MKGLPFLAGGLSFRIELLVGKHVTCDMSGVSHEKAERRGGGGLGVGERGWGGLGECVFVMYPDNDV